ncbi:MAG: hypothetical protein IT285_00560, partial [Bdellovibrionales bacterium]|nr:hypothetical protein [Bdellovibrionales bacterium]
RSLAMAQELAHHELLIATDASRPLGAKFFRQYPFRLEEVNGEAGFLELNRSFGPDLLLLDQLDTETGYVRSLKQHAKKVVTFEDLGPGASEADLVVSDVYANPRIPAERQLTGLGHAILSPSFEYARPRPPASPEVRNILVLFGGTDPSNLAERSLQALGAMKFSGEVTVVQGMGRARPLPDLSSFGLKGRMLSNVEYMPGVMRDADLALSSAGRTITELLSLGIPTLCMCQNEKELTHTHASQAHGVLNIGLGSAVDEASLCKHLAFLIDTPGFLGSMRDRACAAIEGRSNRAVMREILGRLGLLNQVLL